MSLLHTEISSLSIGKASTYTNFPEFESITTKFVGLWASGSWRTYMHAYKLWSRSNADTQYSHDPERVGTSHRPDKTTGLWDETGPRVWLLNKLKSGPPSFSWPVQLFCKTMELWNFFYFYPYFKFVTNLKTCYRHIDIMASTAFQCISLASIRVDFLYSHDRSSVNFTQLELLWPLSTLIS